MHSHAALPVAQRVEGDYFRVYFSSRDAQGRAQIGYFVLDLAHPSKPVEVHAAPVIGLGPLGAFDDNGVTSSWMLQDGDRLLHYYSGWSLGVTVPFYLSIGLAVSDDGGASFSKPSTAPFLERSHEDPYLTASPAVLKDGDKWRMWYVSGARWTHENGRAKHYYNIKHAESTDGLNWNRSKNVCIDFCSEEEYAIARPCVIKDGSTYKMWYSYRGPSYRIGYAESRDGLEWTRLDHLAGIDVSPSGWDSQMIAYGYVFDHGERYMLYNGNGYGESGIGLAVLSN